MSSSMEDKQSQTEGSKVDKKVKVTYNKSDTLHY